VAPAAIAYKTQTDNLNLKKYIPRLYHKLKVPILTEVMRRVFKVNKSQAVNSMQRLDI